RRPFWRIYASGWVEAVNGARPLTHLGGIDLAGEITGAHLVDGLLVLSAADGGTFDLVDRR
ncbi:MAG: hypothetical protein GY929_24160, partial [Actinomycetia bacterium]|nr:hypothetical protein [Actinomycetes bacterium]